MKELTPQAIVQHLDRYIIGQARAKRAVAVALRNRMRRMKLPETMRDEITPKNIMMIGPTGVGKTEIARRIAKLINAPFLKIEVTKFTQVGYVGRDVESIVRDLLESALSIVQEEKSQEVHVEAEEKAQERILAYLLTPKTAREIEQSLDGGVVISAEPETLAAAPVSKTELVLTEPGRRNTKRSSNSSAMSSGAAQSQAATARREPARVRNARKKRIAEALANHQLEERMIEIEIEHEDSLGSMIEYMTGISSDDSDDMVHSLFAPTSGNHKRTRRVTVRDARRILVQEEAQKLIDFDDVIEEATQRVEQTGIVFLDEIDKIVGAKVDTGPDVSGEGVQRDLLPIVEGSTVITRYGAVKTDHVLWIAAGAFHKNKPSDLIPEMQGRFPLRVELDSLNEADFKAILTQPENALTRQYEALLGTEDVELIFTEDGLDAMAHYAHQMNERHENIGARRLHTILEKVVEDVSFEASEMAGQTVTIDAAFVRGRIGEIIADDDLSKYIL